MKRMLLLPALLVPLLLAGCAHPQPYPAPPPPGVQIAHQAYHQGFEAGRHDMRAGLPPDVNRHPRFRRPPVPPPAIHDYRVNFRNGYRAAYRTPTPPPRY
uniref:Lipoprotein n=1 Tax=Acidobacterium capsulatum TaxID=33075 RepID=A0A7V4XUB7_9BACT